MFFEARGEPLACQLKVLDVVLNRINSNQFPDNHCENIKAPAQFSWYSSNFYQSRDFDRHLTNELFNFHLSYALATVHYLDNRSSQTNAMYYMTIDGYHNIEKYVLNAEFIGICGQHLFFQNIEWR